jgi:hypothetical protein
MFRAKPKSANRAAEGIQALLNYALDYTEYGVQPKEGTAVILRRPPLGDLDRGRSAAERQKVDKRRPLGTAASEQMRERYRGTGRSV